MLGLCLVEAQSQEAAERKGIGGAPRDPEGSPVKWTTHSWTPAGVGRAASR